MKGRLSVPSEFLGKTVYFETGHGYGATEIFINGVMVGGHGIVDPKVNFSHVSNTVVAIPHSAVKNGQVEISLNCKTGGSHQIFDQFWFVDQDRYSAVKLWHPFLNNHVYYMMAAICFFLGIYFMFLFFGDVKERANLYFSLTVITMSGYFFDMGSEILYMPFQVQLGLARYSYILSIGFLVMFITNMFKYKPRALKYIIVAVYVVFAVATAVNVNNIPAMEKLFTVSLVPVAAALIFIYVVLAKAYRKKNRNALMMIVGISVAMIFALHDIGYQIVKKVPFAWLQGFAFFFMDITMFIIVSFETSRNKKKVDALMKSTSEQNDRLDLVIKDAGRLSRETMEIANSLTDSVMSVAMAAAESEKKAQSIGEFISKQNQSLHLTNEAVGKLVSSVEAVTEEVNIETETVNSTVGETNMMIEGVSKAANGVESAAEFASTLKGLTEKSRADMASLVKTLEEIKEHSAEITDVIQVVSNFSRQTNMLAMNASIEAAHSGEAGKGFAVIAGEVNKLARASGEQTKRIDEIVTAITDSIAESFDLSLNVRQVLEQVSEGAQNTTLKVSEAAKGLDIQRQSGRRISEEAEKMAESALKVRNETLSQGEYSAQVSKNMEELSEFAEEAEVAADEIVTQNRELSVQASALKDLALRVKEASEDLDRLIRI